MRSKRNVKWLKSGLMVIFGVMKNQNQDWLLRKAQLWNSISRHTIKSGKNPKIAIFYRRPSIFHQLPLPNFGLRKKVWYKMHFFVARYTVLHMFRQVLFGAGNQGNHQNFEKSLPINKLDMF